MDPRKRTWIEPGIKSIIATRLRSPFGNYYPMWNTIDTEVIMDEHNLIEAVIFIAKDKKVTVDIKTILKSLSM